MVARPLDFRYAAAALGGVSVGTGPSLRRGQTPQHAVSPTSIVRTCAVLLDSRPHGGRSTGGRSSTPNRGRARAHSHASVAPRKGGATRCSWCRSGRSRDCGSRGGSGRTMSARCSEPCSWRKSSEASAPRRGGTCPACLCGHPWGSAKWPKTGRMRAQTWKTRGCLRCLHARRLMPQSVWVGRCMPGVRAHVASPVLRCIAATVSGPRVCRGRTGLSHERSECTEGGSSVE